MTTNPGTPIPTPDDVPPMPAPGWAPEVPIDEPAPDLLPDEWPNPNPDDTRNPPIVEPGIGA
ncbi:hypothetical protein PDO_2271 [Rhizobium sp. PDO1-076]|uniref:hypothetical protein n=1 Tax=Rhizobium sp. PDO1-076 TaxID=1125979 RepID=UPI00024E3472|nr:hypothetical protein [Rhizobium sp. PDO1-076]EHS50799.1 hypothetical protein PDO_2271 [Rhizobium sp. PDO1-076]